MFSSGARTTLGAAPEHHLADPALAAGLLDAAVLTTGTRAYRRKDGIAVVPAAPLGT